MKCCVETWGLVQQLQVASILTRLVSIIIISVSPRCNALQIQFASMGNSLVLAAKLFIFDSIQYGHFPRQRANVWNFTLVIFYRNDLTSSVCLIPNFHDWELTGKNSEWDYVLIDWVGGPDGKIFGLRSWRMYGAQRGPCAMNEGQIFSCPARPNSVNKHFIIWPLRFFIFLFCFVFFFNFRVIKFIMFTYLALFDRKVGIYIATKLF